MIALFAPIIFLVLLIGITVAIYKRHYLIGIIIVALTFWFNSYSKVFAVSILGPDYHRSSGFKAMTLNVNSSCFDIDNDTDKLVNFIVEQDPDLLFLAECFEPLDERICMLLIERYPYSTYGQKTEWGGHYFYSKYPLGPVDHVDINSNIFSYCFHCNMYIGAESISIYGCHLASNNYKAEKPSVRPESIRGLSSFGEYLSNIELASEQRCEEVVSITAHPDFNNVSVVMGDFNDVSGSKPLKLLEKAGLKDAWWEKGLGYGATIFHPLPYRIDHIMYGEGLKLKSVKKVDAKGLSDHDALVATFEL